MTIEKTHGQVPANTKKKTPWQLIAILTVSLIPLIGAYVAYYTGLGVPDHTVNAGTILSPATKLDTLLAKANGQAPQFAQDRTWRIFIPFKGQCHENCQENLYLTRQVHVRLGKNAERIERYLVNLAGQNGHVFFEGLREEHPRLKLFELDPADWDNTFAATNLLDVNGDKAFYLLSDPLGYAMMYYTSDNSGNELLKDLKRILRFAPEE